MTVITKAIDTDIPDIVKLAEELGRPKPQNPDTFWDVTIQYITNPDKEILVAKNNDVIVGMASIVFLQRLNHTTLECYIPEIIVSGKYQKGGIGSKLISACVSLAHKKDCHRIRLESGYTRDYAHKFYSHLGFVDNARSFILKLT